MHTGTPEDIQQWYLMASREFLRHLMSNLSVPESILQPYIVRRVDSITNPVVENTPCGETAENVAEVSNFKFATSIFHCLSYKKVDIFKCKLTETVLCRFKWHLVTIHE